MKPKGAARPRRSRARRDLRRDSRDQQESAFAAILGDLVARVPGACAAALVDRGGETVDYAGRGSPYEVRVTAAHFRLVLNEAMGQPSMASVRSLVVRAARASFAVWALPEGYALVLCLSRGAGFRGLTRAGPAFIRRLAQEAGWPEASSSWHAVDVLEDKRLRPFAIRRQDGRNLSVEVLGRFRAVLPEHERAWRVRLQSGIELTLVRESGGFWYADEWVETGVEKEIH